MLLLLLLVGGHAGFKPLGVGSRVQETLGTTDLGSLAGLQEIEEEGLITVMLLHFKELLDRIDKLVMEYDLFLAELSKLAWLWETSPFFLRG